MTRYRTIVADPPWPIDHFPKWFGSGQKGTGLRPYDVMSVDEIKALPVADLAEADRWHVNGERGGSRLFLWTITEYVDAAFGVARAWKFEPKALLVWCKPDRPGGLGGTFKANVEFCLVARRGSPPPAGEGVGTRRFRWPVGAHSEKPAAFFDMVEQVSPGPYLELFARRQRLGWDTWGDEALNHVDLEAVSTQ